MFQRLACFVAEGTGIDCVGYTVEEDLVTVSCLVGQLDALQLESNGIGMP